MKILVTGPQGSGKTTQSKLLAEYLNIPFIGIGELLRQIADTGSSEGIKIKQNLNVGKLVDDEIVANVAKERFKELDCQNGFVADGYPRTLDQINLFNPNYTKVFYLDINDDQVTKRLLKRGREDDTPEVIVKRLKIYHDETEPLLGFFRNKGILVRVDGSGSIDEVQNSIREILT